ncbi:MAG: VanZ family protein [Alkalilacustris sp.]
MTLATLYRLALAASGLVAVLIAILTLMPGDGVPDAPGNDKLHHFVAFATLVMPVVAARPKAVVWVAPAAILFGGAIELIQPFVGRSGEWADMLANTLGVGFGVGLGWVAHGVLRGLVVRD